MLGARLDDGRGALSQKLQLSQDGGSTTQEGEIGGNVWRKGVGQGETIIVSSVALKASGN